MARCVRSKDRVQRLARLLLLATLRIVSFGNPTDQLR